MALFKNRTAIMMALLGLSLTNCKRIPVNNQTGVWPVDIQKEKEYSVPNHIKVFESDINKDILWLRFGDKQVCRKNHYALKTNLNLNKSNPPQLNMVLWNENRTTGCSGDTIAEMKFNVSGLRRELNGKHKAVVLNINGKNCGLYRLTNE